MKLNKAQIIALFIATIITTYFLTSVLIFLFNKTSMDVFMNNFSVDFTYKAYIHNYPFFYKSLGLSFFLSAAFFSIIPFLNKKESLFGNARFANSNDVKQMNLYGDDGIIIGKWNNKLLRFSGQQFVALGAPTRSGKGVGIVIPNLLEWKQSCVVQDIKKECFDYTSKYRRDVLKQDVYLFNPFDSTTHRYNPLGYIDIYDELKRDSQLMDFTNILYPMSGDSTTQFFNQLAQNLFMGLCYLYADLTSTEIGEDFLEEYDIELDFTMCGILELSEGFRLSNESDENDDKNDDDDEEENTITGFEETFLFLDDLGIVSDITRSRINSYLSIDSANTKSGVMSSFNAPLMQFRIEVIKNSTAKNDFDLRDLRKKPMTLYIGITPDQLPNAKLILNIFWSQLIQLNTKELPQKNKDLKYSCLLLEDEFTAIGHMPILQKSVSFIAGYNLRLMMIYQSLSQLESSPPEGYGKEGAKTLLTNHACQIFYTPREQEDAEKISKILGNKTVKNISRSNSSSRGGGSTGRNTSDSQRALMLPQELREMPFEDEIITIDNGRVIKAKKALYYNDKYFMDKFKLVAESLKDIKGIPDRNAFENAVLGDELNIQIPIQGVGNEF